ncbi:peptidoglycan/LPS O-acetylase OafA/YrhL [Pelomonas aquatica]|uniref:Peptidoglycan/LPS O-acetylase OafA/YrhL n=1 Tax=Pelomonas aquatica TaxID=431058 RepID=A0ABU1Z3A4_9BURK|nr:acyltransferase [Pelomonas aquatica]MDR7295099.1 peptidoglycan/LPS O-acetylase OafA/YrhL [Pelomonas aquatica]
MRHHFPGLDLLRSIAIAWVMLFHAFLVGGLGPGFAWLSRFGWAGVDIFFVLSGFLIGSQLLRTLQRGERLSLRDFYQRRAWRILPAFAVVLAVYAAFPVLREAPGLEAGWQFATFTLNLLIDYSHNQAFSHAWSLCVEEHFYLLFPLVAWWFTRRPSAARFIGLCGGLVMLGIALRTGVWLRDDALNPPRNWFVEDIYYPTWMRLDGLLAGVVLAALRVYRPALWARLQARSTWLLMGGLATAGLALWLFRDRTGLLANAVGWPLLSLGLGLLVLSATAPRGWLGRWRVPGAGWVAAISYSLYLSHKLAMHAVHEWLAPMLPVQGLALFAVYAAAIVLVGAALHHAVERPCLRLRDRAAPAVSPGPQARRAAG